MGIKTTNEKLFDPLNDPPDINPQTQVYRYAQTCVKYYPLEISLQP